jgi:hypothetical protein
MAFRKTSGEDQSVRRVDDARDAVASEAPAASSTVVANALPRLLRHVVRADEVTDSVARKLTGQEDERRRVIDADEGMVDVWGARCGDWAGPRG